MSLINSVSVARGLIRILQEFKGLRHYSMTAEEYVQHQIVALPPSKINKRLYQSFVRIARLEKFFDDLVDTVRACNAPRAEKSVTTVLAFMIVCDLTEEGYETTVQTILDLNYNFSLNIVQFFNDERNLVDVAQAGVKVFENEFVLKHIIEPLLEKRDLIANVYNELKKDKAVKGKVERRPLTRPVGPACSTKTRRTPSPPLNTPVPEPKFKSKPVSKSVLQGDWRVRQKLERAQIENREKALHTLKLAHDKAYKCAVAEKKYSDMYHKQAGFEQFVATKMPTHKPIIIKGNVASVLREAAKVERDRVIEKQKINALLQSAFDPSEKGTYEQRILECQRLQYQQQLEKRHLLGQITFEEALLARRNFINRNLEKAEEFKEETKKMWMEVEKWRISEEQRILSLVNRAKQVRVLAKAAGKNALEKKKMGARLFNKQLRQKLEDSFAKTKEQLRRKAQIILELRSLQKLRENTVKSLDPTETKSLGLFCEMSLAELRERLKLVKIQLHDEIMRQKRKIFAEHYRKQMMLKRAKEMVADNRELIITTKPKPNTIQVAPQKQDTPELTKLRQRLENVRLARKTSNKLDKSSVC